MKICRPCGELYVKARDDEFRRLHAQGWDPNRAADQVEAMFPLLTRIAPPVPQP